MWEGKSSRTEEMLQHMVEVISTFVNKAWRCFRGPASQSTRIDKQQQFECAPSVLGVQVWESLEALLRHLDPD